MALTVESLKGLYEKLGGVDFGDVTTIPEAIDKITEVAVSGGGDTYETVAEIEVGTMTEQGGIYSSEEISASIPRGETLYFNSPECEMEYNDTITSYLYNFSAETPQPTGTPAYVLAVDSNEVVIASDTDLSNTTVRILKKVSGGGSSGGAEKFVVTLNLMEGETDKYKPVDDTTVDDVINAADTGKICVVRFPVVVDGDTTIFEAPLVSSVGEQVVLYAVNLPLDDPTLYSIIGVQGDGGDTWIGQKEILATTGDVKPSSYTYNFAVTLGESEGTFNVSPDSGATYAAISAALAETPNVYANIDFAPLSMTFRARFDIDIPGDPENALTANTFLWAGTKWIGARLAVVSDGSYGVEIHDT